MYYVKKTLEISAAHRLTLDYESKCTALHGHNWIITVFCRSAELDQNGMVVIDSRYRRANLRLNTETSSRRCRAKGITQGVRQHS